MAPNDDRKHDNNGDSLTLVNENLLRRAIFEGDNKELASLLKNYNRNEIVCGGKFSDRFFELLSLAIHVSNDGAVRQLLEIGVNPNQRLVNETKIVPLINAVKCGRMFSIYERDSTLIASSVAEIVRLLLEHGAEALPREPTGERVVVGNSSCSRCISIFNEISLVNHHENERIQQNPLFYLHHLAVNSPQAADLLLRAVPGQRGGYDPTCNCETTRQTPLSALLLRASRNYGCVNDIAAIFQHAILPLLRNGARLSLRQLISNANLLAAIARMNAVRSLPLWQRPNAIADVLIESNDDNYGHLKVSELLEAVTSYEALFGDYDGDWVRYGYSEPLRLMVGYLRAQFPRPLQACCRAVILNRLEKGYGRRREAIDALQLPRLLTDYLNFTDLNLFSLRLLHMS